MDLVLVIIIIGEYLYKTYPQKWTLGCKAVGPGGPDSISLWLFQALISHLYSDQQQITL